jgi:hypothetical protein
MGTRSDELSSNATLYNNCSIKSESVYDDEITGILFTIANYLLVLSSPLTVFGV